MDQTIQVQYNVGVQVFYHVARKHTIGLLIFRNEVYFILLKVLEQNDWLLVLDVLFKWLLKL